MVTVHAPVQHPSLLQSVDSTGCDFTEAQTSTAASIADCVLNEHASAALPEAQDKIIADRERALQERRRNNNATPKTHTAQEKESSLHTASA